MYFNGGSAAGHVGSEMGAIEGILQKWVAYQEEGDDPGKGRGQSGEEATNTRESLGSLHGQGQVKNGKSCEEKETECGASGTCAKPSSSDGFGTGAAQAEGRGRMGSQFSFGSDRGPKQTSGPLAPEDVGKGGPGPGGNRCGSEILGLGKTNRTKKRMGSGEPEDGRAGLRLGVGMDAAMRRTREGEEEAHRGVRGGEDDLIDHPDLKNGSERDGSSKDLDVLWEESLRQELRVGAVVADSQRHAGPERRELLVLVGGRTRDKAEHDGRSMEATVRSGRVRSFGKEIGSYDVRKGRAPSAGDCLLGEMEIQRGLDLRGRSAGGSTGKCQTTGGGNEGTSSRGFSNVSNWGTNFDDPNAMHANTWHTGPWHTSFEHAGGKILEL